MKWGFKKQQSLQAKLPRWSNRRPPRLSPAMLAWGSIGILLMTPLIITAIRTGGVLSQALMTLHDITTSIEDSQGGQDGHAGTASGSSTPNGGLASNETGNAKTATSQTPTATGTATQLTPTTQPTTVGGIALPPLLSDLNLASVNHFGVNYAIQSPAKSYSVETGGAIDRFEVRTGESWSGDKLNANGGISRNRAELSGPSTTYDQDWWGAFDFLVPADSVNPAKDLIMGQFHAHSDYKAGDDSGAGPVLAFHLDKNGDYYVDAQTDHAPAGTPGVDPATNIKEYYVYKAGVLSRGAWHHVVYMVRFSQTGMGHLTLYFDGHQVYDADLPIGYNDSQGGPYWKYGVYRLVSNGTSVAYFANMQLTTVSLQPQVADPLPIR